MNTVKTPILSQYPQSIPLQMTMHNTKRELLDVKCSISDSFMLPLQWRSHTQIQTQTHTQQKISDLTQESKISC